MAPDRTKPSVGVANMVHKPHKEVPQLLDCFIVTAPGLAPLVAAECTAIGITPRDVTDAGVAFDGTLADVLQVNLWSRMASRVLMRLASFEARDFATLEKQAQKVPWARVLQRGMTARLRVTCRKSKLYHSDAVAERVARGIERSVAGVEIDLRGREDEEGDDLPPAQLIVVRFDHDRCTISADSSGELLHRRGWRQAVAKAPLRETLAAAMLVASEWDGNRPLVDPFCGSGTIGIEAALRVRNIAPGLERAFALEAWPGTDAAMVRAAREAARAQAKPSSGVQILLADRDAGACDAAVANAERAGVLGDVIIAQQALSDADLAAVGPEGLVLTNPPYGLRVTDKSDIRSLYARLGDVLRAGGKGWQVAMLIPDKQLVAQLKVPYDTVLRTANGGLAVSVEMTRAASTRSATTRAGSRRSD